MMDHEVVDGKLVLKENDVLLYEKKDPNVFSVRKVIIRMLLVAAAVIIILRKVLLCVCPITQLIAESLEEWILTSSISLSSSRTKRRHQRNSRCEKCSIRVSVFGMNKRQTRRAICIF